MFLYHNLYAALPDKLGLLHIIIFKVLDATWAFLLTIACSVTTKVTCRIKTITRKRFFLCNLYTRQMFYGAKRPYIRYIGKLDERQSLLVALVARDETKWGTCSNQGWRWTLSLSKVIVFFQAHSCLTWLKCFRAGFSIQSLSPTLSPGLKPAS